MAGWSTSSESELQIHESRLHELIDAAARLRQIWTSRALKALPSPGPKLEVTECLDPRLVSCSLCSRDHQLAIGPELRLTESADGWACWKCGLAVDVCAAAVVLSERAQLLAHGAYPVLALFERWQLQTCRESGQIARAEHLQARCDALRAARHWINEAELGFPATWSRPLESRQKLIPGT